MTSIPEGAIRGLNGGYLTPMTPERAKEHWRKRRQRAKVRTPDPATGRGAIWWRKRHADTLADLTARFPANAARLIDLRMVELMLPFVVEPYFLENTPPDDYICAGCKAPLRLLFEPLVIGSYALGWFHPACSDALLARFTTEARQAIAKVLSPRRSPP